MINILITGGSGFIGRNLKEYLSGRYSVFAPTHNELDLFDPDKVRNYIVKNKVNIIIHCANIGGGRNTVGLEKLVETNLRMFFNIVRNEDIVEKIIHFGSGAEYDKSRQLMAIQEEEFGNKIPKDDYGFYKFVCSKYILRSAKLVCLRLFGVYGKYENYLFKFISNAIVKNLFKMPIVIGQNVYFDYLYIDDLVRIVEYFVNNEGKYKDYNIATGRKTDLITITQLINKISSYQSKIIMKNLGLNLEYSADNKRLAEEIPDFKFTKMEEGIEKLREWYKIHLKDLDIKKIKEDPYIKFINIHHS